MKEINWYEKLTELARHDHHYQACLAEVKRLEPGFLVLRDSLTGQQRQILDGYLSACEEMDHALLMLAPMVCAMR